MADYDNDPSPERERVLAEQEEEVEVEYCEYMIYAETRVDPAEYCDEPAVPGQAYCVKHLELIDKAYEGYVNQ